MIIDVSIIICCYNSVNRLQPTLEHLAKQQLQNVSTELIIVDNNSSDSTSSVAEQIWLLLGKPFGIAVVSEPKQGLSYARWRGIAEAVGKYVLFCDDDNWLQPDYVFKAYQIMESDTKLGALCGKNNACYEQQPEEWFMQYETALAVGHKDIGTSYLTGSRVPWGAGLVMRKTFFDALQIAGFHSLLSDRSGKELSSGGDTELCYVARLMGYSWKYDESLQLTHYIPKDRITLEYLSKLYSGFGKAQVVITYFYAEGDIQRLHNSSIQWYKVFLSECVTQFKKSGRDFESKLLVREWKKGYLMQLWRSRKLFVSTQKETQGFIKKICSYHEGSSH